MQAFSLVGPAETSHATFRRDPLTPQRAVDRLRRLAADQAAQQDLGRRREHPWLAAQLGDPRAPVLPRALERLAQRPVAEEVRPRGAEVAVDVEAEADLRPLRD